MRSDSGPGNETPTSTTDDRALAEAVASGDEAACAHLVRTHGGRMLQTARRYLVDEQEARDAVQDAFVSAFRSIGQFRGGSQLGTWLHRITINSALMRLRRRRRRPEVSIEALLPTFLEDGHRRLDAVEWTPGAELAVERRELREAVHRGIDALPDGYRTVLLLRDIEELDTRTTARRLGISDNAVKLRLHRARQALRAQLASYVAERTP